MRFLFCLVLATLPWLVNGEAAADPVATQMPLVFSGGHDTDPRDHGRPVVLVAGALKVPPEVFREAFTHVHPAGPNSGGPTDAEARANKRALMDALAPYGVTDDRLNQVSNRYRYRSWMGELWPTHDAAGYATVSDGKVTSFVITDPGFGYSSLPQVSVKDMPNVQAMPSLAYGPDFEKNGAVVAVSLISESK